MLFTATNHEMYVLSRHTISCLYIRARAYEWNLKLVKIPLKYMEAKMSEKTSTKINHKKPMENTDDCEMHRAEVHK